MTTSATGGRTPTRHEARIRGFTLLEIMLVLLLLGVTSGLVMLSFPG